MVKRSVSQRSAPPLGLAYIASALSEAGHKVSVLDCIAEAPYRFKPLEEDSNVVQHGLDFNEICDRIDIDTEVIGLTIMFTNNWLSNRKLIDYIGSRFPFTKIIIGGEHASAVPEYCIQQTKHLDVVVIGEGEETIVELVNNISDYNNLSIISGIVYRGDNNIPHRTPPRKRIKKIDNIAWPAWEFFPTEIYFKEGFSYGVELGKTLPIMATRGCPYICTFCSSPDMWGTRYSMRKEENVVSEITFLKNNYGVTNFDFFDLTAIINKRWIINFAKKIIEQNLNITWQIPAGTRSEVIDNEVAYYLYQSGCRNITYAPESGAPYILQIINKKVSIKAMLKSIRASKKEGLNIKLNMMIGFPDEKMIHILQSIIFLIRASWAGAHDSLPAIFSPYPGSHLYNELSKSGEINIVDDNYLFEIIYADSYSARNKSYSKYINAKIILLFAYLQFTIFYLTNYIFRPHRLIKTIINIASKKYESRAELILGEILKRENVNQV